MTTRARINGKLKNKMLLLTSGFAFIVIVMTIVFIHEYRNIEKYDHLQLTSAAETTVGPIVEGTSIVQEIPYHEGDLGADIEFATYKRKNSGKVRVTITGKNTGTVYADETKPAKTFEDNAYVSFFYQGQVSPEDSTMLVSISSTSKEDDGLTVWVSENDALPGYNLGIDGIAQSGDMVLRTIVPGFRDKFAILFFGLQMVVLVICYLVIIKMENSMGKAFFLLTLCLGFLYMLVMTPMAIPDEQTHYQSAYKLSNVLCFQWNDLDYGDVNHFDYSNLVGHVNTGSAYDRFMREIFVPKGEYIKVEIPYSHSISYPVMLIPQAIGIALGRLLGANFLITFYLARFCNLLFYSLCIYYAVERASRFKLMFGMLGIMPMALHQAASCSYDTFINGMMFVLLAQILNAIDRDERITVKEIMHIAVLSALLSPAKAVYTPVLLCLCLIPVKRFSNNKLRWGAIGGILILCCCLIFLFQLMTLKNLASSGSELNWEGEKNYTVSFILQYPQRAIQVFYQTLRQDGWGWIQQGVGRIFAGHSMRMDELPIYAFIGLLIVSAFSYEGDKRSFTCRDKITFMIAAMGTVFAVMLTMFLGWTSDTRPTIQGIQGRYFIPIFPLLLMCFNNKMIKNDHPVEKYVSAFGVLINFNLLTYVLFVTLGS